MSVDRDSSVPSRRRDAEIRDLVPQVGCSNGHVYRTVFPASYTGTPCRECGQPLERVTVAGDADVV